MPSPVIFTIDKRYIENFIYKCKYLATVVLFVLFFFSQKRQIAKEWSFQSLWSLAVNT